jgi:uncharacterized protein YndB with AHSA1/START domain
MRVEQDFTVARPPDEVFAYMTDPANLRAWQPSKLAVEPLTDGPPRRGYRLRETTKVGVRRWDQVVEFTEFVPGRALTTHIVEGSMPVDGRWTLADDGRGGTRAHFVAEGRIPGPMRLLEPLVAMGVRRSFRHYHELLARNVEAAGARAARPPHPAS